MCLITKHALSVHLSYWICATELGLRLPTRNGTAMKALPRQSWMAAWNVGVRRNFLHLSHNPPFQGNLCSHFPVMSPAIYTRQHHWLARRHISNLPIHTTSWQSAAWLLIGAARRSLTSRCSWTRWSRLDCENDLRIMLYARSLPNCIVCLHKNRASTTWPGHSWWPVLQKQQPHDGILWHTGICQSFQHEIHSRV